MFEALYTLVADGSYSPCSRGSEGWDTACVAIVALAMDNMARASVDSSTGQALAHSLCRVVRTLVLIQCLALTGPGGPFG
jgi:hypothetical protein